VLGKELGNAAVAALEGREPAVEVDTGESDFGGAGTAILDEYLLTAKASRSAAGRGGYSFQAH
jgi:hypothetical protein